MRAIRIETVPHSVQRYNTLGDYQHTDYNRELTIRVSACGDFRYEALLAVHELVEALICEQTGITEQEIDTFDLHYAGDEDEPGNDLDAPYYQAHQVASGIERMMAAALGVHWPTYETVLKSVEQGYPHAQGHQGREGLPGAAAQGREQGEGGADRAG